jgi:hypothetical protein
VRQQLYAFASALNRRIRHSNLRRCFRSGIKSFLRIDRGISLSDGQAGVTDFLFADYKSRIGESANRITGRAVNMRSPGLAPRLFRHGFLRVSGAAQSLAAGPRAIVAVRPGAKLLDR